MGFIYAFIRWIPLVWLLLAILLGFVEAVTTDLVAIWFAVGALAAIVPASLLAPLWVQLLVFLGVSLITLCYTRPMLKNVLKVKKVRTNADQIIGMMGVVVQPIDNVAEAGRVHVNGLDWSARSDDGVPVAEGEHVLIRSIEGVKVIVERML